MDERSNNSISGDVARLVAFQNSQGAEIEGTVLRLERHRVVFEIYSPSTLLRTSEVLGEFRIHAGEKDIYSGRAVVSAIMHTGALTLYEASLESGWADVDLLSFAANRQGLGPAFDGFIDQWHKFYKIRPE